jgi:hypothetical protein
MNRSGMRKLCWVFVLCLVLPLLIAPSASAYVIKEVALLDIEYRLVSTTVYGVDDSSGEYYSEPGSGDPSAGSAYYRMTTIYGYDPYSGEQPIETITIEPL